MIPMSSGRRRAALSAFFGLGLLGNVVGEYTVYTSVIFARTGERTPVMGLPSETVHLTAYGAHQMVNLGAAFRARYIGTGQALVPGTNVIPGLSTYKLDNNQLDISAIDAECTAVSAQAFMQGFYPPFTLLNATAKYLDPTSIMANDSYIDYPLQGYSYPTVRTLSEYEPESIYLTGATNCVQRQIATNMYFTTPRFNQKAGETAFTYEAVRNSATLGGSIQSSDWSYYQAYGIYDYVSFMNNHNSSAHAELSDPNQLGGKLEELGALASELEWETLGNLSVSGSRKGDQILAIGGRTLAAKILGAMMFNLDTLGAINKVNLMVGEFPPMTSLFSLLGIGNFNHNFKYIPPYGSALAFELFSYNDNNTTPSSIPDPSRLYVRFVFRNGSDPSSSDNAAKNPEFHTFPLFGRGPSGTEIPWAEFQNSMADIMLGSVKSWCEICAARSLFCAAFDGDNFPTRSKSKLTPAAAGGVGAVVTLVFLGMVLAAAMFFGGVRWHRRPGGKSNLAGFRGSAKLASDADLHIPKNGAPTGESDPADPEVFGKTGQPRVGSWELKETGGSKGHERFVSMGSTVAEWRPSFEGDSVDPIHGAPVQPRESV